MREYIRNLWRNVPPPREATVMMGLVYLLAVTQGVWSFFIPSDGAEHFDQVVRTWVLVLLSGGGIIGFFSLPWGVWMLEKAGIFMLLGVELIHLTWVVIDLDGNGLVEPGKFCRLGIIIFFLIKRYFQIRGRDLDPTHTGTIRICSKKSGGA